jgi:hypothetical protein
MKRMRLACFYGMFFRYVPYHSLSKKGLIARTRQGPSVIVFPGRMDAVAGGTGRIQNDAVIYAGRERYALKQSWC